MPLGTLQLIYVGEQNIYVTQNPEITFFKTIYKRHTNFAIDTVREYFTTKIGYGQQVKCKLSKNGDLLNKLGIYIKLSNLNQQAKSCEPCENNNNCLCTCPKCLFGTEENNIIYGYCNAIGHVLLDWIEIWIGGKIIDKHYGEWLEIWTELTQTSEKRLGYYEMIGKKDPLSYTVDSFNEEMEIFVPFNFWFCRNIGLSLPVLALIYQDVDIIIKIREFDQCWVSNIPGVPRPKATIDGYLFADYIYLSMDERHNFYQESHIYLIEQLQRNENNHSDFNSGNLNVDLYFNHLVKEMIWFVQRQDVIGPPDGVWPEDCSYPKGNDHFNYTTARIPRLSKLTETFDSARLLLSGTDRTYEWPAWYYRLYQNYYYHTRIPTANYLYVLSFGYSPEEHQPTGELNFSVVDNARLIIKLLNKCREREPYPVHSRIYATNYNILLITGGMGATLFEY